MIDPYGFADLRNYIKRRLSYARYRIGSTYYQAEINDISVQADNTVRVVLDISPPETGVTVSRIELYNTDSQLWAHQDCRISIGEGQTSILFWFDFTIVEQEKEE